MNFATQVTIGYVAVVVTVILVAVAFIMRTEK